MNPIMKRHLSSEILPAGLPPVTSPDDEAPAVAANGRRIGEVILDLQNISLSFGGVKAILLPGSTLRVGRTDLSDFALAHDGKMSGEHFALAWDGARATLRGAKGAGDLDRRNGNRGDV